MKRLSFSAIFSLIALLLFQQPLFAQVVELDASLPKTDNYIFVVTDAGRNGSFDQRTIGDVMGRYADSLGVEFVLNCGDMFHYDGVQSLQDPLFMTNYELIYRAGELQCPWYGVLGNHEYRGSTAAVMDYTNVSRRWNVPSRYYAKTFQLFDNKSDSLLIVFMDTAPMIDKYRTEDGYPDAKQQNPDMQVKWLENTLKSSKAKWKIVVGHHPVYSYSKKAKSETDQMQSRVAAIFEKYGVDLSLSGHVHTLQHIQPKGAKTEYFVLPSASLGRKHVKGEYTKFTTDGTGFTILAINDGVISLNVIGADGKIFYSYPITKK